MDVMSPARHSGIIGYGRSYNRGINGDQNPAFAGIMFAPYEKPD
jgi:hypothetical protein